MYSILQILNTSSETADGFNTYFSNIATDHLKQSITSVNIEFNDYLIATVENFINLTLADASEVHGIINNFQNTATRDTKISALKIANASFNFTSTLATIIYKSFQQGIFPDQLKIAKVIQIHNEGSKTDVGNYRPIYLLSTISKIYEK